MLISEKGRNIIDNCRFCWMCRHVCPIGNATGQERNTARARALALSMVARDMEFSPDIVDNIYECGLCGGCTNNCVTGFDPIVATKEARLAAAMEGKTPEYIKKLVANAISKGNVYGKKLPKKLADAIDKLPKKADTVLFLGQDARYIDVDAAIKAIELLKKAGVKFTVLKDEPNSGYNLDTLIGAAEETKSAMQNAADVLNFKNIIAYDPADAKVFMREYKEWGIKLKGNVKTFTSFIAELIKGGALKVKKSNTVYTFQDPSLLARDLSDTESARKVISSCGKLSEMLLCKEELMWSGNLIMNEYMPDVMKQVALNRWDNVEYSKADIMVTADPAEHVLLSKTAPKGKTVMTVEEVVLAALK